MFSIRWSSRLLRSSSKSQIRAYSSLSTPPTSPFAPRHFLSTADLTPTELTTLVRNAFSYRQSIRSGGTLPIGNALLGKTIAVMFSKRSTRTRVSTEAAIAHMSGHPLFLGAADIQLGVNESLRDTSIVVSSMVEGIVARVHGHEDVMDLAKHSTKPVINALSDKFHPMQIIADILTMHEAFLTGSGSGPTQKGLGLEGLKIAWVGDANNVLFDLAIAAAKLGIHVAVATPKGFEVPEAMEGIIRQAAADAETGATFNTTWIPEEAVKDADVIVTDTWVSMGQEADKARRLKQFEGFQVTADMAKRGGAKEGWKFMHCLPRKPEEVSDEVFYNPQRSLVFPEAENRLYSAIAVLEAFVVNQGNIKSA